MMSRTLPRELRGTHAVDGGSGRDTARPCAPLRSLRRVLPARALWLMLLLAFPAYADEVRVELTTTRGLPPTGFVCQRGVPFPLTADRQDVRRPRREPGVVYGEVPLANGAQLVAVDVAGKRLFVDRDRDGDLAEEPAIPSTGSPGIAAELELSVRRRDGTTFPYLVWLFLGADGQGFNYYGHGRKDGRLALAPDLSVRVSAGDAVPLNAGTFEHGKVHVDWNGDGEVQDPEWLAAGDQVTFRGHAVRLVRIAPYADAVTFDVQPADGGTDVERALASEPIVGNPPLVLGDDVDGQAVDWADYRGKVVLVDFWATWCGPCMRELPSVKATYDALHERGFEVLGVSLDTDLARMRTTMTERACPWRQVCDGRGWESEVAARWRVRGIPATFLVGKDGRITAVNLGGEGLRAAVERELAR
jgi:thiol-disulfide isomerase/thioredoxin